MTCLASRPNGPGWRIRVVPNRFPALKVEGDLNKRGDGIYDKMNGIGAHEVIIECPFHELTMAKLSEEMVAKHGKDFSMGALVLAARWIAENRVGLLKTN